MGKQITPVHYEVPAEDVNGILDNYAWQIKRSLESGVKSLLEVGKILLAARDTLNNRQKFAEWVEKRFPFSVSSAYQYVVNYQNFGSVQTSGLIEHSAMTALATNERARKEALKIAARGEPVSHSLAKAIIGKCSPKPQRLPPPAAASDDIEDAEFSSVEAGSEVEQAESDSPKDEPPAPPKPPVAEKDYGTCPNCAGTKWTTDDDGTACSRCHHPHGEGLGGDRDEDDEFLKTQRSKTIKTAEALLRAFDDLHLMVVRPAEHAKAIACCKSLVKIAKEWQ